MAIKTIGMIFKADFKIDLFELRNSAMPAELAQAHKDANARQAGIELIKLFPFKKVSGYDGEIPEMSANKDHKYKDVYGVELVVLEADQIRSKLAEMSATAPEMPQLIKDFAKLIGLD